MSQIKSQPVTLHILGAGRAAGTLAKAWVQSSRLRHQIEIGQVCNQSLRSAQQAVTAMDAGEAVETLSLVDLQPDRQHWLLLGLPDGQIASAAQTLAQQSGCHSQSCSGPPVKLVFHLSGQLDSSVLQPLADCAEMLASAHPVLAFARPGLALQQLSGSYCLLQGSELANATLETVFQAIGMQCIRAQAELDKARYHAAMVAASNFTCALQYMAQKLATSAGLSTDQATDLLMDLNSKALLAMDDSDPLQALTGPIERGDRQAIRILSEAWSVLPDTYAAAMRQLAMVVLDMALEKGRINRTQYTELQPLLQWKNRDKT